MNEKPLTPDPSLRITYRPILQHTFNLSHVETVIAGYLIEEWNLGHDEDLHIKTIALERVSINTVTPHPEVVKALGALKECSAFHSLCLLQESDSPEGDLWIMYEVHHEIADDFLSDEADHLTMYGFGG
jgi:hypothetical protein